MGLIKRIVRHTADRLLSSIGAQRGSQCLVLNPSPSHAHAGVVIAGKCERKQRRKGGKRAHKKQAHKSSREAALQLAAKNHLPPVQFHHVHGETAQLADNYFVARRTSSFCQAIVFSNRIILPNERVYLKVLELAKGWSGTIRFGFTSVDPATLRVKMPKHVCPDMTNAGHTWARALADDVVRKNSVIHFSYDKSGFIHYGINNQDCGIFCANVNTSQHLWFVVDVYGLTAAVELIDPRARSSARLRDELHDPSMIYKTAAMAQQENLTATRRRSNLSRASLRRRFGASRTQTNFIPELKSLTRHYQARDCLPNIHSALFPVAQQNIYSPMPGAGAVPQHPALLSGNSTGAHDYHQIGSNPYSTYAEAGLYQPHYYRQPVTMPADVSAESEGSRLASSSSATVGRADEQQAPSKHQLEICHQLSGLQLTSAGSVIVGQQQSSKSTNEHNGSSTTTTTLTSRPVAAARKRLQNVTNSSPVVADKRDESAKTAKVVSSGSQTTPVGKPSKSNKSNKSATKDGGKNPPPTKDCPICFERPINCVLYQCGHMCTCYECGVKQWRTQSRTCPICRTVIKDVIKTYMS